VVEGSSVKRTDFEIWRGFLLWAEAKSEDREGLLGDVMVGEVGVLEEELNCVVRSESWCRRRGSWDVMALSGVSLWWFVGG
jgi:hypothetical protein